MIPLYVYRRKSSPNDRWSGYYASVGTSSGGKVHSVFLVSELTSATIFRRGDILKKDLPNRGKNYDMVEVTVMEK